MAGVLLEAGVVFAVLAIGGAVAARFRQSVIPAYILAGVLLGPHTPLAIPAVLQVETREFVTLLQELGIVLLLFFIGLEFNLERLLAARDRVVRAGMLDFGVNALVGFAIGLAFGFSLLEAVFLAGIVYISSSAVITKTLIDLGWVADPEAEAVLGVLVFEDVLIAFYLALLAPIALGGDPRQTAVSLAVSLGFIAALVALAFYGTGLLERLLETRSDELFLLRVVGAAALLGGVALALGVSEAVAAFFLGAAFGSTSHAHRIEAVITSERDLYAAVFFFAIGLVTDPSVVATVLVPLGVLVALTLPSKFATGYAGGRTYGLSVRRSVRVGVSLVARGEFSLVIAALAVTAGLDPAIPALAVGYVLVMSVLGTVAMRHAGVVERAAQRVAERATAVKLGANRSGGT